MLILFIILFILTLLCAVFEGIILWKIPQILIKENQNNIFSCKLFLMLKYNQSEDKTITDFSLYNDKHIIFITEYLSRPPETVEEVQIDGQLLYKDYATVYEMGGNFYWII